MDILNKENLSKFVKTASESALHAVKSVKDGANTVAEKSKDLVEISKLTLSISSEESKIKELYIKIGQEVFEKHSKGIYIDPDLVPTCNDLLGMSDNITAMKEKINELKNKRVCTECNTELADNIVFCPKCGSKQELKEEVEILIESTCDCHDNACNCCNETKEI